MPPTADVVVIGAGIAGLSAAWELAADASVVVLEQEVHPATHATGRSAAVISETYGPAEVCAIAAASRRFLTDPPADFTDAPLVAPRGMLWVSDRANALDAVIEQASGLDITLERASIDRARELVGALRPEWIADALYEPDVHAIDVGSLVEGYRTGLLARGGTILTAHQAMDLTPANGSWEVHHNDGVLRCATVVNAAGAWADVVAARAGVGMLGLQPLLRTAFLFPSHDPGASSWPLVMDFGGRFYFEPEGELLLASPADETLSEPHDARADELAMAKAADAIAEATTLQVRGVRQRWAGLRTFAPDRLPVVGLDPRVDGFFWLAGQGGAGIKTAPALAALTRNLITGSSIRTQVPFALEAIGPERLIDGFRAPGG